MTGYGVRIVERESMRSLIIRALIISALLTVPKYASGQVITSPYVSAGWANHLAWNGVNYELGLETEFFRRADLTLNYRHMNVEDQVIVSAFSMNISYIIINRNNHRLMAGPGLSHGNYKRYTETPFYDKDYISWWFDYGKIRYDYTINDKIRLGIIGSLSGDDGDGSTFVGLLLGLKI
jgi:hypothetical protein